MLDKETLEFLIQDAHRRIKSSPEDLPYVVDQLRKIEKWQIELEVISLTEDSEPIF